MDNYHYGTIGNCRSAALISRTGSIDWCCLPDFDSASVFAKLLDEERGGAFSFDVDEAYQISQRYEPKTNILCTSFDNGTDAFDVYDFMPRYHGEPGRLTDGTCFYPPELTRYIRLVRGRPVFAFNYDPRPYYAQHDAVTENNGEYLKSMTAAGTYESVYLYSDFDLEAIRTGAPITLERDGFVVLSYNQKLLTPHLEDVELSYQKTKTYWMTWSSQLNRQTHYHDMILRSALTLKMMTYQKSGAVIAALTTSLPETPGECRNWDYRFCWIRDASMTISVLTELGDDYSVRRFVRYILSLINYKDEKIQIMYGIRGHKNLTEQELDHLAGYLGSRPVRIGNAAYQQKQNDIYGVLLDVIARALVKFENHIDILEDVWTIVRTLVRNVEEHWHLPDKSIWEIRGDDEHFVFSKVLCWVAVDRGIRIAHFFNMRDYVDHWNMLRTQIYEDILANGWNEEVGAFTQSYGSRHLDSANLLMEEYGFINARDPKFVATVDATLKDLCRDGLMYRYRNADDFGMPKSSFTVCTFWMVNALYRVGRTKEAQEMFDHVVSHANHVGLLAEDIDFETGRQLGNFPQAYSHLALINCAHTLSSGEPISAEERLSNQLTE
ncbi:glycoside hydrolase family 15 protein [Planctomycetales bacterium ZRK34]|nr:glycoside hydrolase family 15 protein [Planctomycetales bacterium ZRK34]